MNGICHAAGRAVPGFGLMIALLLGALPWARVARADGLQSAAWGESPAGLVMGSLEHATPSRDGEWIWFLSDANNLTADDDSLETVDLFRKRVSTGKVELALKGDILDYALSGDGAGLVVESFRPHPELGDSNNHTDIYHLNLATGKLTLCSATPAGVAGSGPSQDFEFHPDGRYVAFFSAATNFHAMDLNGELDLFLYDIQERVLTTVTTLHSDRTRTAGSVSSGSALFLPGTTRLLFPSSAKLTADATTSSLRAFSFDAATKTLAVEFGPPLSWSVGPLSVSGDGGWVLAEQANPGYYYTLKNMQTGVATWNLYRGPRTLAPLYDVSLSHDGGRILAMQDRQWTVAGVNPAKAVPVPRNPDGTAMAYQSGRAVISPDGKTVWMNMSTAANPEPQLYEVNVDTGEAALLSRDEDGQPHPGGVDEFAVFQVEGSKPGLRLFWKVLSGEDPRWTGNSRLDVRMVDLPVAGPSRLLSEGVATVRSRTLAGVSQLDPGGVSPDGSLAAISSAAQLTEEETFGHRQIYLRNLKTGAVEMVTKSNLGEMAGGRGNSSAARFSGDGRTLLFQSTARDLRTPTVSTNAGLYAYDLRTRLLERIDVEMPLEPAGHMGPRGLLEMSHDGSRIIFSVEHVALKLRPIYIRDRVAGTTRLVSRSPFSDRFPYDTDPSRAQITPDGSAVFYEWNRFHKTGPPSMAIIRYDVAGDATETYLERAGLQVSLGKPAIDRAGKLLVCWVRSAAEGDRVLALDLATGAELRQFPFGMQPPQLSEDGRWIMGPMVHQPGTNDWRLVSMEGGRELALGARADGSWPPRRVANARMDAVGAWVVHTGEAANPAPGMEAYTPDELFLRHVESGRVFNPAPRGAGFIAGVALSRDGRSVFYHSRRDEPGQRDFNQSVDIHMIRFQDRDEDGDSLPDWWEHVHFESLAFAAEGDEDGDGQTNRQEYLAATHPANNRSLFAVKAAQSLTTGAALLEWPAAAGRRYQPQWREDFNDATWRDLGTPVTALGDLGSAVDPSPIGVSRYYRVVLLEE